MLYVWRIESHEGPHFFLSRELQADYRYSYRTGILYLLYMYLLRIKVPIHTVPTTLCNIFMHTDTVNRWNCEVYTCRPYRYEYMYSQVRTGTCTYLPRFTKKICYDWTYHRARLPVLSTVDLFYLLLQYLHCKAYCTSIYVLE